MNLTLVDFEFRMKRTSSGSRLTGICQTQSALKIRKAITVENMEEWMNIDNDEPVAYQTSAQEIVEMLKQGEKNEEHEENVQVRTKRRENISIDKCIQMKRDLIARQEQRDYRTRNFIYLLQ